MIMLINQELAIELINNSENIEEAKEKIKNMPIAMKDEYVLQHIAGKCSIKNCKDTNMTCPVDIKLTKFADADNVDYLIFNVSYIKDGYAEIGVKINDDVRGFFKSLFFI